MKKTFLSLISIVLLFSLVFALAMNISADQEEAFASESATDAVSPDALAEIPDNPDEIVLTMGLLNEIKEQLKQEILAELGKDNSDSDTQSDGYHDVTLKEGQMIILSHDSEVIFRGGKAVAITSACSEGEGVKDLSDGNEIFSGESLKAGHIYLSGESFAKKAILITGQSAYFTLRGSYEIV